MLRRSFLLGISLAGAGASFSFRSLAQVVAFDPAPWRLPHVAGDVLVRLLVPLDDISVIRLSETYGAVWNSRPKYERYDVFKTSPGNEEAFARALIERGVADWVSPNIIASANLTPNDPYYSATSGPQTYLTVMNCPAGWDIHTMDATGGLPPVIDMDTGAPVHVDTSANILTGFDATGSGINDTDGHATIIDGPACAVTNNSSGIASVSWGGKLLPVKVATSSSFFNLLTVNTGLQWVIDNVPPPAAISMPFTAGVGSTTISGVLQQLWNLGFILFGASGDSGTTICQGVYSPYVMLVAGVTNGLARSSFSSYGPASNGVGPGAIISVPAGGSSPNNMWTTGLGNTYNSGNSGTSFSPVLAASVACGLWSVNPSLKNWDIYHIMSTSNLGQSVTGFTGVSAPWDNPRCLDYGAMMAAAKAGLQSPYSGRGRRR